MPHYHRRVDATSIEARLAAFFEADPRGAVAVGILFVAPPPVTLDAPQFVVEAELERLLGRPVQVVALNSASPDLVHRVLRDGRLVLDRDRSARIRFEVRARNEYFDMEPIRRLYRRYPVSKKTGNIAEPGQ